MRRQPRSRLVYALAILLLLQAAGLVGAALIGLPADDLRVAAEGGGWSPDAVRAVAVAMALLPPAFLALLAAAGALMAPPRGRLVALLAQSMALAPCLWLYLAWRPVVIYPIMLSGIALVLALNTGAAQAAFRPPAAPRPASGFPAPEAIRGR